MLIDTKDSSYFVFLFALYLWGVFSFVSISALAIHHGLVFLAVLLFYIFKTKASVPLSMSAKMLACFGVVAIFSVLWNAGEIDRPLKNILRTKYIWAGVAIWFLSSQFSKRLLEHKQKLLLAWLASFLVAILYGFYCVWFAEPKAPLTSGFFGYYLSYSYLAQFGVILLFFLSLYPKVFRLNRNMLLLCWVLTFVAAYNVYLNQARGPLLSLVLAIPLLFICKGKKILFALGLMSALGVGGLVWYVTRPTNNYMEQRAEGAPEKHRLFMSSKSVSNQMRLSQYQMAWAVFKDDPIFGAGWRSLEQRSSSVKVREGFAFPEMQTHAHNNFLEALSTTGILGLIFYVLWIFYWLKESVFRNRSLWKAFFASAIAAYVVSGMFQSTLIDAEVAFSLFALYGLTPLFIERKETA